MAKRLTGGAGTGKKIIKYWADFSFRFEKQEDSIYFFKIRFFNQKGDMNIKCSDGKIEGITLNCNFDRPLGDNNDSSLLEVGNMMMKRLED